MPKASVGKTNININIRDETVNRIKEIQERSFYSNVGDVIDLAVALLYEQDTTKPNGPAVGPSEMKNNK